MKKLRPDCFEDIVAAGALYRPGPLEGGMVDDFIERKHGRKKVEYDHPSLEPILKDTYGVIVYQEQVMQISSALAGYSLGKADLLRRAMGKKKAEVMAKEKAGFMEGAKDKGVDPKIAERVFDLMEKFAGYGFNRSHSAAYGLLTYQTAYLKRYWPVEFFAALLTCDKDDTDAVVKFIAEAKAQGIAVLRPDVNESDTDFTVVISESGKDEGKKVIRFGLGAVKGVGEGAVEVIQAARDAGRAVPVAVRLLPARRRPQGEPQGDGGAGEGRRLRRHRRSRTASRGRACSAPSACASERAAEAQRDRESGQTNLLALLSGGAAARGTAARPGRQVPALRRVDAEGAAGQREGGAGLLHQRPPAGPLRRRDSRGSPTPPPPTAPQKGERAEVVLAGVVTNYQERPMKNGQGKYAFLTLEDHSGQIELIVNSRKVEEYRDLLSRDEPLLVTGIGRHAVRRGREPRASACASWTPSCCPRCAPRRARCWTSS